jgi:hypothetical protein
MHGKQHMRVRISLTFFVCFATDPNRFLTKFLEVLWFITKIRFPFSLIYITTCPCIFYYGDIFRLHEYRLS